MDEQPQVWTASASGSSKISWMLAGLALAGLAVFACLWRGECSSRIELQQAKASKEAEAAELKSRVEALASEKDQLSTQLEAERREKEAALSKLAHPDAAAPQSFAAAQQALAADQQNTTPAQPPPAPPPADAVKTAEPQPAQTIAPANPVDDTDWDKIRKEQIETGPKIKKSELVASGHGWIKPIIGQMENTVSKLQRSAASSADTKEVEKDLKESREIEKSMKSLLDLFDARGSFPLLYPDGSAFKPQGIGLVPSCEVVQVINGNNVVVNVNPCMPSNKARLLWLSGLKTGALAKGSTIHPNMVFKLTGNKNYKAANGKTDNLFLAEPVTVLDDPAPKKK